MESFVDIHTHVLPGVDDGPSHIKESLAIMREASAQNVSVMAATPHTHALDFEAGRYYESLCLSLNESAELENIATHVVIGAEYRLDWELVTAAKEKKLIGLGGTNNVLVELPFIHFPQAAWTIFSNLRIHDYQPVIAHPERNEDIQKNPLLAKDLVEDGNLLQINTGSILGVYGKTAKRIALSLLEQRFGYCLATDSHEQYGRSPNFREAYPVTEKLYGRDYAEQLCDKGPKQIIAGEAKFRESI